MSAGEDPDEQLAASTGALARRPGQPGEAATACLLTEDRACAPAQSLPYPRPREQLRYRLSPAWYFLPSLGHHCLGDQSVLGDVC